MTDLYISRQHLANMTLSVDHLTFRNSVLDMDDGEFSRIEFGTRVFSWLIVSIFGLCFSFLLLIHWRTNGYQKVRQVIET